MSSPEIEPPSLPWVFKGTAWARGYHEPSSRCLVISCDGEDLPGRVHQLCVNCLPVLDGRLIHPSEELRWAAQFARHRGKKDQACGNG
ncbi:MAG: hypothetical protein AMJ92_02975 [candidate division Zixibacteria bacterium SM23_81]|nr:MAG: hypothetical protein AMJ92_02975 [candidate division Zixibacteria bacterium SM23_81]